jgi:hypothetical protein
MPLGKDVKKNMTEITDKHPDWSYKRRLAASLNAARAHSADTLYKRRRKMAKKSGKRKK